MSDLPCIITNAKDVTQFLACFYKQMFKHRLFHFLNGLDDVYQAQRSQILLMTPLPSVEIVCGMLQQEEQQRQGLEGVDPAVMNMPLFYSAVYKSCKL